MDNWVYNHISRGAADALFQLALLARTDADGIRQFFFDSIPLWQSLDAELTHPPTEAHHANP